ncbi:GUN4 domain-containing protein [Okeania sp. SIO2C2]|uniref:GUN4 domain-containing protein n=1 Tax=Okeania sp. SIO2C2 TaxID=2607787 RepID=UPI00257A9FEE|nr:GUN4 domain-containing protein [Okeania sp. SIO2C2]
MQKKIYQSLGGTKEYNREVWEKFGEQVGWKKGDKWLSYNELNWTRDTSSHYTGYLPFCTPFVGAHPFGGGGGIAGGLFCRAEDLGNLLTPLWGLVSSLAQRLVECNI